MNEHGPDAELEQQRPDAELERYMRTVTIGELEHTAIDVVDYDPAWPQRFGEEAARIREALGERARLVEHVGSTAVPELPAKPVVDILLVVDDPADEGSYVPDLEAAGYVLRIRSPTGTSTACSARNRRTSISTSFRAARPKSNGCCSSVTGCGT